MKNIKDLFKQWRSNDKSIQEVAKQARKNMTRRGMVKVTGLGWLPKKGFRKWLEDGVISKITVPSNHPFSGYDYGYGYIAIEDVVINKSRYGNSVKGSRLSDTSRKLVSPNYREMEANRIASSKEESVNDIF